MIITVRVNITPNITLPLCHCPLLIFFNNEFVGHCAAYHRFKVEFTTQILHVSEFNKFEPRLKSAKNRFLYSTGMKSWNIKYNFKWNQPYLSRVTNSLNSASESLTLIQQLVGSAMDGGNPWLPWASTMQKQASPL